MAVNAPPTDSSSIAPSSTFNNDDDTVYPRKRTVRFLSLSDDTTQKPYKITARTYRTTRTSDKSKSGMGNESSRPEHSMVKSSGQTSGQQSTSGDRPSKRRRTFAPESSRAALSTVNESRLNTPTSNQDTWLSKTTLQRPDESKFQSSLTATTDTHKPLVSILKKSSAYPWDSSDTPRSETNQTLTTSPTSTKPRGAGSTKPSRGSRNRRRRFSDRLQGNSTTQPTTNTKRSRNGLQGNSTTRPTTNTKRSRNGLQGNSTTRPTTGTKRFRKWQQPSASTKYSIAELPRTLNKSRTWVSKTSLDEQSKKDLKRSISKLRNTFVERDTKGWTRKQEVKWESRAADLSTKLSEIPDTDDQGAKWTNIASELFDK